MDPRPRKTVDLLGILNTLRSGLVFLITIPAFVGIIIVVIFQLSPREYGATATFVLPAQSYTRLATTDFGKQVALKVAERGGNSESKGEPTISQRTSDGTSSVSYVSESEAEAILYVTVFAELAYELVTEEALRVGTTEQAEKQIELDAFEDYRRRIEEAADAMLQRLQPGDDINAMLNSSSDDIGDSARAYKMLVDTLRTKTVYLRVEQLRLEQMRDDLRSTSGQIKVTSSSTAKYRLVPVLLASVIATMLIVAAFLLAKDSLIRSTRNDHHAN